MYHAATSSITGKHQCSICNYNKQFKGVMVQAGVRVENTNSTGDSYGLNPDGSVNTGSKQTFKRNYTDVFPSAAISFNKNPMNQWGIIL